MHLSYRSKTSLIALLATAVIIVRLAASAPVYGQEKTPVILLPGLGASFNWNEFFGVGSTEWRWTPTAEDIYDELIEKFENSDYDSQNGYLTIFFYDWRDTLNESARKLDEEISKIKQKTGSENVDIVGHSMGGLVARTYLQSTYYDNDIRNLITLGSPHFGLPNAYFAWEGGKAYGWEWRSRMAFELLKKIWQLQNPADDELVALRQKMPGLQDLLPIWPYLYDAETGAEIPINQYSPLALNQTLYNLFPPFLDLDDPQRLQSTRITVIAGRGRDTLCRIFVRPDPDPADAAWSDGQPDFELTGLPDNGTYSPGETCGDFPYWESDGDGTVLSYDPFFPGILQPMGFDYQLFDVDHTAMPADPRVQQVIFAQLGIPWSGLMMTTTTSSSIQKILLIFALGPVEITLERTTPGTEQLTSGGAEPMTIIAIPNPEGEYRLKLQAIGEGEYRLGAAVFVEDDGGEGETRWFEVGGEAGEGEEKSFVVGSDGEIEPAERGRSRKDHKKEKPRKPVKPRKTPKERRHF